MQARTPDDHVSSLELPASMDFWDDLFGFVQEEAVQHLKGHAKEYKLILACEELISNIIRYNSGTTEDGSPVSVRIESSLLELAEKRVYRVRISDNGPAFDPHFEAIDTQISDIPIDQRKIGGLGLFLIKTSVDDVKYAYTEDRNTYTMDTYL